MSDSNRIARFFEQYKMRVTAAKQAEKSGNLSRAQTLYREAASSLLSMAELEKGETQKQRLNHAREVLDWADNLGTRSASSGNKPQSTASSGASGSSGSSGSPSAVTNNAGEKDEENPWKSEGIPSTTFDDVIGMEDVKKEIRTSVIDQIKYPQLYEAYGLKGGTGVLLYGLPGTGKTTVARAIAHEIGAPLYTVQSSDVLNKWVGESEKRIRQLFDAARAHETVLIFFDDFDSLGSKRQDDGGHHNKVIVELINQMDGFRKNTNTIVLLAATNKPWLIDSALMRPGRFEHHFYVPLANHEARIALVKLKLGKVPVDPALDFDRVSDLMKGYNGADITSVVGSVKRAALQRAKDGYSAENAVISPVTMRDFEEAAAGHKTSVDPGDIVQLRQYAAGRNIILPSEL